MVKRLTFDLPDLAFGEGWEIFRIMAISLIPAWKGKPYYFHEIKEEVWCPS